MASHAHSTRTPLLPPAGPTPPLLGQGSGRQPGPVTAAIRAMREADPNTAADRAIEAIRQGLGRYFSEADLQRAHELRRCIADRIEADIALLDALAGDADLEDVGDLEPALGSVDAASHSDRMNQLRWSIGGVDDREKGDDNGIADRGGEFEQMLRFRLQGGSPREWQERGL